MADEFKKTMDKICGPGGTKCYCCNCYHGKDRKILRRLARVQLKREDRKKFKEE